MAKDTGVVCKCMACSLQFLLECARICCGNRVFLAGFCLSVHMEKQSLFQTCDTNNHHAVVVIVLQLNVCGTCLQKNLHPFLLSKKSCVTIEPFESRCCLFRLSTCNILTMKTGHKCSDLLKQAKTKFL